jgi:chromate transport protein ChrA
MCFSGESHTQNFAVFLGALAYPSNPVLGAALGYLGIFFPGLILQNSLLPIWTRMRKQPRLNSLLKGIACGAIGLVFTAVYRLWRIGLINRDSQQGSSIDNEPWFVLVSVTSFTACKWFKAQPPVAIVAGGILGMIWYGVVGSR